MTIFHTFFFYFFGVAAVASAIAFVTRKSPVAAALWLVNAMFCLSALFMMLDAQFIGVIQVLVYAGAIMVVFIFVIMLLNLGEGSAIDTRRLPAKLIALVFGLALIAELFAVTRAHTPPAITLAPGEMAGQVATMGAVATVAGPLFREYLLAFEITSVLLLIAVVGAVVLGKRRSDAH